MACNSNCRVVLVVAPVFMLRCQSVVYDSISSYQKCVLEKKFSFDQNFKHFLLWSNEKLCFLFMSGTCLNLKQV